VAACAVLENVNEIRAGASAANAPAVSLEWKRLEVFGVVFIFDGCWV